MRTHLRTIGILSLLGVCMFPLLIPSNSSAQTLHQELVETVPAEVLEIMRTEIRTVPGTDISVTIQEVRAILKGGEREGQVATFENELALLEPGDHIFVNHLVTISGETYYQFKDVDRRSSLLVLATIFVFLLVWLSRSQGVRALLSLALSVIILLTLLVPMLLAGTSPSFVSLLIASTILALVLFGTHGFNPRSTIALFGTMSAVGITCFIAWVSVTMMHFTGLSSDAAIYLNFSTKGALDFSGLLLGSIIIGILGILDDVSITQASVVEELKAANPTFKGIDLYTRAIRVGRDHIGSLVNTLALAYIGASLPLVLLLAEAESDIMLSLNQELVSVEIVRILVGSIGLVLAVPFTTAVAAWWYRNRVPTDGTHRHEHGHSHT